MPPSVIQSKRASLAGSLLVTVTLDNPPSPGNALIASYRESDGTTTPVAPVGFEWAGGFPIGVTGRQSGILWAIAEDATQAFEVSSGGANTKTLVMAEVNFPDGTPTEGPTADSPNTLSITSLDTGSTGELPDTECYVMAYQNLTGSSGGNNQFTNDFLGLQTAIGLSDTFLVADKITSIDDALNPTFSWTTLRGSMGGIAAFYDVDSPPIIPSIPGFIHRRRRRRRLRAW